MRGRPQGRRRNVDRGTCRPGIQPRKTLAPERRRCKEKRKATLGSSPAQDGPGLRAVRDPEHVQTHLAREPGGLLRVDNITPVLGPGGPGGPCHRADDPWHHAPILSERAGQVKPEPEEEDGSASVRRVPVESGRKGSRQPGPLKCAGACPSWTQTQTGKNSVTVKWVKEMVGRGGIEPPTPGFSGLIVVRLHHPHFQRLAFSSGLDGVPACRGQLRLVTRGG